MACGNLRNGGASAIDIDIASERHVQKDVSNFCGQYYISASCNKASTNNNLVMTFYKKYLRKNKMRHRARN